MWMRIEVWTAKDGPPPTVFKGETQVFEGNWTGIQCGDDVIFNYNGPDDVEMFETYDSAKDNRKKRDLERVPP